MFHDLTRARHRLRSVVAYQAGRKIANISSPLLYTYLS
jgi:hypothetical protein